MATRYITNFQLKFLDLAQSLQLLWDLPKLGLMYDVDKYCQNIFTTIGVTKKSRAFLYKSCQNISTTVQFTKRRAILYNSCQNCAILLYHNNISILGFARGLDLASFI